MVSIEQLLDMYKIFSPSGGEDNLIDYVDQQLRKMGIQDYKIDKLGNVYRLNPGEPVLCAHMDQVQSSPCYELVINEGWVYGKRKTGQLSGLGADDKNGVWLILRQLEKFPFINFVLTVQEETGGLGLQNVPLEVYPYCLVLDRRNFTDLIGKKSGYNRGDLDEAIIEASNGYFKSKCGLWSDADFFAECGTPTANLSVGYLKPHTVTETTFLPNLAKIDMYVEKIINELEGLEFEPPEGGYYGTFSELNFRRGQEDDDQRSLAEYQQGSTFNLGWSHVPLEWEDEE